MFKIQSILIILHCYIRYNECKIYKVIKLANTKSLFLEKTQGHVPVHLVNTCLPTDQYVTLSFYLKTPIYHIFNFH
jgi:hypothetical protein